MDCKLAKGLSSEQLAEIEKKAQGITMGGPTHFSGAGGSLRGIGIPPPPPVGDAQKMEQVRYLSPRLVFEIVAFDWQEFSSFMSELSGARTSSSSLDALDDIPSQLKCAGLVSTPPPGWFVCHSSC